MNPNKPKVYVIVPVTIPGMKKSVFYETFHRKALENNFGFSEISIKKVKKEFIDNFVPRNPRNPRKHFTEEEKKKFTERDAKIAFKQRLGDLVRKAGKSQQKAHFVYIEKNHPPGAFEPTLKVINENSRGIDLEIIALVPSLEGKGITCDVRGKKCDYPFSSSLFFTCFDRVQKRKGHETLNGSGSKSAKVSLAFLNMFKNVYLDKKSMQNQGFDKTFCVPFCEEGNPAIPQNLEKTLIEALQTAKPVFNDEDFDGYYLEKLNTIYEELQLPFKDPDAKHIEDAINKFLEEEIYPEVSSDLSSNQPAISGPTTTTLNPQPSKPEIPVPQPNQPEEKKEEKKTEEVPLKSTQLDFTYKKNQSHPIFLGIFSTNLSHNTLKEYVLSGMRILEENFQTDQPLKAITADIQTTSPSFKLKFIEEPHVMAYYIGEDKKRTKDDYYKKFKSDEEADIELAALVIIPDKLVIALCNPDNMSIKVDEEYPHMTLMKGDWNTKVSSDVLEALVARRKPLHESYSSKELFTASSFVKKIDVEIPDGSGTAYIVKPDLHMVISSKTGSRDFSPYQ